MKTAVWYCNVVCVIQRWLLCGVHIVKIAVWYVPCYIRIVQKRTAISYSEDCSVVSISYREDYSVVCISYREDCSVVFISESYREDYNVVSI